MKHIIRLAVILAGVAFPAAPVFSQGVNFTGQVGLAAGSATAQNPLVFDVYTPPAQAGGGPVANRVTIPNLPAWPSPANETPVQASVRKATTICTAINAVLGAGRCTVGQTVIVPRIVGRAPNGQPIIVNYPSTPITITGVAPGVPPTQVTNPCREIADGGRFGPGQGGGGGSTIPYSPGMGSPGTGRSPQSYSATGLTDGVVYDPQNPLDTPDKRSMVEFGIEGLYVARYFPETGDSLGNVLTALGNDLEANGIPTTYYPAETLLVMDRPWMEGEMLLWSNTDTGLDFSVNMIPEPGSAGLLLAGALMLSSRSRRRRR